MVWLLLVISAFAQEDVEIIYKKRTEIDFEGVEVEGQLVKPQGSLIVEKRMAAFNPLITIRQDFNVEISESVQSVK